MTNNLGDKVKGIANQLGSMAGVVERFVEDNIIEKEQREQNLRKMSLAFEAFLKERFSSGFAMHPVKVPVKTLENFKGDLPKYESLAASGMDVRAQLETEMTLNPGERYLVPTGLSMAIPQGYEIQARPRSGWAIREGVSLVNTPGTIDADYRGEIKIIVINHGQTPVKIKDQDRIAQLVLCPVVQANLELVDDLDKTERGAGGFGSTGAV